MMRTLALVLLWVAACERADDARSVPAPVTVPVPAPAAPPSAVRTTPAAPSPAPTPPAGETPKLRTGQPVVAPHEVAPMAQQPKLRSGRPARILSEEELPTPPSDDPEEYRTWYRGLAGSIRAQVDAFCRREGWDDHAVCGGIGPYHIPVPPSLAPVRGATPSSDPQADHDAWLASLTPPQRHYYEYWCIEHTDEGKIGYSQLCGATPLVAQLDPAVPIELVAGGVNAEVTPWLALDRDGDGAITSAAELFGDATPLPDGTRARNGFEALAQYDANHDGVIDAHDPIFDHLVLWNGTTATPLGSRIRSIELANQRVPRCNRFGCEGERSVMTTASGQRGAIVDVYIRR